MTEQAARELIIFSSLLAIASNKHKWTSEGILFQSQKDVDTHHFSSTGPPTLIYSPVWFVCLINRFSALIGQLTNLSIPRRVSWTAHDTGLSAGHYSEGRFEVFQHKYQATCVYYYIDYVYLNSKRDLTRAAVSRKIRSFSDSASDIILKILTKEAKKHWFCFDDTSARCRCQR